MNFELEKKIDKVFMSKKSINPYLNSKDDLSLSTKHPKRTFYGKRQWVFKLRFV